MFALRCKFTHYTPMHSALAQTCVIQLKGRKLNLIIYIIVIIMLVYHLSLNVEVRTCTMGSLAMSKDEPHTCIFKPRNIKWHYAFMC